MGKLLWTFSMVICAAIQVFAQTGIGAESDRIYKSNIRTVQLFMEPLVLSDPVIPLGGTSQLHLAFDDLDGDKKIYYYTIVQCNYDWTPSELNRFDYLEGFIEQEIREYEFSFNTNQTYTHYRLLFPNESMRITKSGNYIIRVYPDGEAENPILMKRFIVFESRVEIISDVDQPEDVRYNRSHQQLNFSILHKGFNISNAFNEINVLLLQNFRWDNAITNLHPVFIKPQQLDYTRTIKTAFPGGKEFRYFETRTTRYNPERVQKVEEKQHLFHFTLYADAIRNNSPYFYRKDANGKFTPGTLDYFDQDAQADYVWVNFTLPVSYPLNGGKIYLTGQLTNWQLLDDYELRFNPSASAYQASLFLKQGYYEYFYYFLPENNSEEHDDILEGNSYETENAYQILVYYRPFGARYDQVIGYKATDTFNR